MERLWPEAEPDAALNNFFYALHVARRALDSHMPDKTAHASLLCLVAGVLALAPGRSLCIDVEAFRTAATAARLSRDPSAYRRAINLYDGELLPEDPYADWAARPREELRDEHVVLLLELARVHHERRENAKTIVVLTRLVNVEPTCEDACSTLMRLHAADGHRLQALRAYTQLQKATPLAACAKGHLPPLAACPSWGTCVPGGEGVAGHAQVTE